MKSNKGVTLASLLVYIAVLLAVIVILSRITTMFNKNLENVSFENEADAAFSTFNSVMLTETKKKDNIVIQTGNLSSSSGGFHFVSDDSPSGYTACRFSTRNMISYANGTVFYNKVKICSNVSEFKLLYTKAENNDGKATIAATMKIGDKQFDQVYTFR